MNIQHVIYALEVYDYHSFTEAAKALYISQPRLSQAIRELEDELGFDIFIRNKKGISGATVKGYQFLEQARILMNQFSALESLKEHNVSSFNLATTLITQAQDAFMRLCLENIEDPLLQLNLRFCGCYEAVDRIKSAASDLGVVTMIDDQFDEWMYYFRSNNIDYHELSNQCAYISTSKDGPLAELKEVTPDDLMEYTYIAEKCSRMNDLTLKVYALLDKICPNKRITVSNTDMMYTLASQTAENRTFIFEPIPPKKSTLDKYGLISKPFKDSFNVHFGYITSAGHKDSELTSQYIDFLYDEMGLTREDC